MTIAFSYKLTSCELLTFVPGISKLCFPSNYSSSFLSPDFQLHRAWQKGKKPRCGYQFQFMEYRSFYEEKSQTLYFTGKRNLLQSKDFKKMYEFQEYENGLSKIYQVKISF